MPGDNPRLLEALPKKDHFHYPLNVLVFSSEWPTFCIFSAPNSGLVVIQR